MAYAPSGGEYISPPSYRPQGPVLGPHTLPAVPVPNFKQQTLASTSPYGGASQGSFASLDPGYQSALASQQAGNQNADSAYKAALSQALIGFGDSSLAGQYKNLDPNIVNAINANTSSGNSILARLQQANKLGIEHAKDNLAARGLINSGGLGADLNNQAQNYAHSLHDSQAELLSQLQGYLQNYLTQKQGYQDQVNQSLAQAYQNYISNPAYYTGVGGAPQTPQAPPPTTALGARLHFGGLR